MASGRVATGQEIKSDWARSLTHRYVANCILGIEDQLLLITFLRTARHLRSRPTSLSCVALNSSHINTASPTP